MEHYLEILRLIELRWIGVSCLLFCLGLILSPWVVKNQLRILLFYPLWIWNLVKKHLSPNDHFLKIFFFIFFLNSISLFANLISGFFFLLPFIFALLLGMNLGIINLKETGKLNFLLIFLNPISLFELPAAWISLSMGIKITLSLYPNFTPCYTLELFHKGLYVYIFVIMPLLGISGIIEATLIKILKTD